VPDLPAVARPIVEAAGGLVATSANLAGEPDPCRVDDIPPELRDRVAAIVDGGELPGTPSTVIDFTGEEPRVLREGAAPADEALARVREALAG
jgi:L-threonylcarbamoyladenylate synthase